MVLSAPAQAVPHARRCNVTAALFSDDHACLWRAADATYSRGTDAVLMAAADELARAGYWHPRAGRDEWRRYRWSFAGLAAFACSWATGWLPLTAYCVGLDARELNRVHMLVRRADALRRDAARALEDASYPPVRRVQLRRKRVLAVA